MQKTNGTDQSKQKLIKKYNLTFLLPWRQLKKIWLDENMDNAHTPEIISGQLNVMKTYLKARYRRSDLLRAQQNDRTTSNLKRFKRKPLVLFQRI